jgi:ATP-dependent DNA helicase DinG
VDATELLGPKGPLARQVPGFAPRPQQQAMAAAVAAILEDGGILIVEAGTGTGKTFAYLAPVLRSGARVIISTGTRHLQDQLYHQDLPVVRRALKIPVRVALLKGRGNYLCLYRLQATEQEGRLPAREQVAELRRVHRWAGRTRRGDIAEISDVPESSPLWPRVTSTVDNCLGQDCPNFNDCFFVKARREALAADVLVINHHLFCADLALKETGFAELLPGAEAVILDEAHQLPEIATHFFGRSLSGRQLNELARDTIVEQARDAADFPELRQRAEALEPAALALRQALGAAERRALWREVADRPAVREAIDQATEALERLREALKEAAQRGKGLENCARRAEDLTRRLAAVTGEENAPDSARWFETYGRGFTLKLTPLDIAPTFRARLAAQPGAWIFTSATLAVGRGSSTSRRGWDWRITRRCGWTVRSISLDTPCCITRRDYRIRPRRVTRWRCWTRRCRCWRPVGDERFCCLPATEPCARRRSGWRGAWTIRCWCRARRRKRCCCGSSGPRATRCCWGPPAFGKGWTCAVKPCRA